MSWSLNATASKMALFVQLAAALRPFLSYFPSVLLMRSNNELQAVLLFLAATFENPFAFAQSNVRWTAMIEPINAFMTGNAYSNWVGATDIHRLQGFTKGFIIKVEVFLRSKKVLNVASLLSQDIAYQNNSLLFEIAVFGHALQPLVAALTRIDEYGDL